MKIKALCAAALLASSVSMSATDTDSLANDGGIRTPLLWRIGTDISPAWVPGTNSFLKGEDSPHGAIRSCFAASLQGDFSFNPHSRQGMLYPGLYQGLGISVRSLFNHAALGTPVSFYVYQGAPVVSFGHRFCTDYECKISAAFSLHHGDKVIIPLAGDNAAVSTAATAHMAIGFRLRYRISPRWDMTLGAEATHFSNGNTSLPNAGVNSIGASVGLAYKLNPQDDTEKASGALAAEADRRYWFYDITAYGAWRKRGVNVGNLQPELCPGVFGVAGLQLAPMYKFNRWVAAGAALDLQYDESAGLPPYWVEGSGGDNIKFRRPPLGRQISIGVSAHAEFTMPIFAINAGMGYDFICPVENRHFYQSLTLKTFVTRNLYLNAGYRLGDFKEPQNLMLGVGIRLK